MHKSKNFVIINQTTLLKWLIKTCLKQTIFGT